MNAVKELVAPKEFYNGLVLWQMHFFDIEINKSRSDFRCGANDNKDLIQGFCYQEYMKIDTTNLGSLSTLL